MIRPVAYGRIIVFVCGMIALTVLMHFQDARTKYRVGIACIQIASIVGMNAIPLANLMSVLTNKQRKVASEPEKKKNRTTAKEPASPVAGCF